MAGLEDNLKPNMRMLEDAHRRELIYKYHILLQISRVYPKIVEEKDWPQIDIDETPLDPLPGNDRKRKSPMDSTSMIYPDFTPPKRSKKE